MRKTLHGKRHVRSRYTVQVGRDKKHIRKFNRGLLQLRKAIAFVRSGEFALALSEAIKNVIKAAEELRTQYSVHSNVCPRCNNKGYYLIGSDEIRCESCSHIWEQLKG